MDLNNLKLFLTEPRAALRSVEAEPLSKREIFYTIVLTVVIGPAIAFYEYVVLKVFSEVQPESESIMDALFGIHAVSSAFWSMAALALTYFFLASYSKRNEASHLYIRHIILFNFWFVAAAFACVALILLFPSPAVVLISVFSFICFSAWIVISGLRLQSEIFRINAWLVLAIIIFASFLLSSAETYITQAM